MKIATRWLAAALVVGLVVMTGKVRAQEKEQARTPEQVVSEFSYALAAALKESQIDSAPLNEVVGTKSREALSRWGDQVIEPLATYLIVPRLVPHESVVDGDTATVAALLQLRSLEVKLVKEEGQWKVDLLGTLAGLPEPFAVTAEELAAGGAAPQPQLGEQPPAADTGEAEQSGPVVELSLANFKPEVLDAEVPVLVCFWAEQSDDALLLKLMLEDRAHDYIGQVKFAAVDTAQNIPLTIAFDVTEIPCLVLFRGEKELARRYPTTPVSPDELDQWLAESLEHQE